MVCKTRADFVAVGEGAIELVGKGIIKAISCVDGQRESIHRAGTPVQLGLTIALCWKSI